MSPVFADTSFFIALICGNDKYHAAAVSLLASLDRPIVTTHAVLIELGNFLSKRPERSFFPAFVNSFRSNASATIIPTNEESFDDGLALYSKRLDKQWSLTDCISFAVMTKAGLTDALTSDHHFTQVGFHALLIE